MINQRIMKKVTLIVALIFSTTLFAQESPISIRPKNFKDTIQLKLNLLEETDLTVKFFDNDIVVKELTLVNVVQRSFKINLKNFGIDKTYIVKFYNVNGELVYTDKITKSLKY